MRIEVGSQSVDWLALHPQSDSKQVVLIEEGARRVAGTATESIGLIQIEGRPALHRMQTLESGELGSRRTESIVFRDGFAPYRHLDVTETWTLSVAYREVTIAGERRGVDGYILSLRKCLETPVFDYHSVEMLLRVLPLTEGYAADVPVFHGARGRLMDVNIRVLQRETITDSGRALSAWKVRTDWDGVRQLYWVGEKTRGLLKQASNLSQTIRLELTRE